MKECYRCHTSQSETNFYQDRTKPDGLKSICKECDKEKRKTHYKQNILIQSQRLKEYEKMNKLKRNAKTMINYALATGKLIKPIICENCGNRDLKLEGHHADYSKPLEVSWLCRKCHINLHRRKLSQSIVP